MGFFKRKAHVTPTVFITHEAQKAVSERANDLRALFDASKTSVTNEQELATFAAFIPLLAMNLAHLSDEILRGYSARIQEHLRDSFGNLSEEHFRQRTLEYLRALDRDIADDKAHLVPTLITLALENIAGKSDASVAICRMGLVKVLLHSVKVDVEFFKNLKLL